MRVIVTGGAGAVGTYLCEKLLKEGHKVACLDNLSTGREENIKHLLKNENFRFKNVDLKDINQCRSLLPKAELIYHLAGSVGVVLVDEKPLETITNNLKIGENVFTVAAKEDIKVIFTSSREVYGNGLVPGKAFREDDSLIIGPSNKLRWGYASSKLTQEFLLKALSKKSIVVRLFNVVSPLHRKSYVVPSFIQKAQEDKPLQVYGDGSAKRCYIHVKDAVEYLYRLGFSTRAEGETYNIGNPENNLSVLELAKQIQRHFGSEAGIDHPDTKKIFSGQHDDIDFREPDIKKVSVMTGFLPQRKIKDIINEFSK